MEKLITIGENISRYGIVFILLVFGIFKFTATEAEDIKPLIDNSLFFNWMIAILSIRVISGIIGVLEIIAAIAIGLRFFSPQIAFYGSLLGSTLR